MRAVDPFSFFVGHASVIPGLGGPNIPADPRYCFHTSYFEFLPRRVIFHLTIRRPRATYGELNVRVLALPKGRDASVAAGVAIDLGGLGGEDIHRALRFLAVEGVIYALYGFVTDGTDLQADSLEIALEELGLVSAHAAADHGEAGAQRHARIERDNTIAARRLVTDQKPRLDLAYAQPVPLNRTDRAALAQHWPMVDVGDPTARGWGSCLALEMLALNGAVGTENLGLVVGLPDPGVIASLQQRGCHVDQLGLDFKDGDLRAFDHVSGDRDFVMVMATAEWLAPQRLEFLAESAIECLAKGGFISLIVEIEAGGSALAFRNRMQQLTLHCIGRGHDVMQMAFPPTDDWYPPSGAINHFIWIARK